MLRRIGNPALECEDRADFDNILSVDYFKTYVLVFKRLGTNIFVKRDFPLYFKVEAYQSLQLTRL